MKLLPLLVLLAGCSTVAPYAVPALTLELCDQVKYERIGMDATITAKCRVPAR